MDWWPCANSQVFNSFSPHKSSKQDMLQMRKPYLGHWITCLLSSSLNVMCQHSESTSKTSMWSLYCGLNCFLDEVKCVYFKLGFRTDQMRALELMVWKWPRMPVLQDTQGQPHPRTASHPGSEAWRAYKFLQYTPMDKASTAYCLNANHMPFLAFICESSHFFFNIFTGA